ncbi:twin-arginine translocation signal domain-containing protein, partial [Salmonella enterica subsp. enterica serovar Oranienburg]
MKLSRRSFMKANAVAA